jgi:hypothetical protein
VTLPGPLGPRLAKAAAEARGEWLLFLPAGAELDPGWVAEVTQFIERAPTDVAAVFTAGEAPRGQGSIWQELLGVFRSRGSLLRPGRGLLISRKLYRELGAHSGGDDAESAMLRRIGTSRINALRTRITHQA